MSQSPEGPDPGQPQQPYNPYAHQNPYRQQPYGYPQTLPEHPQGTTILVLGIVGFVSIGICGVVAWVMGNRVQKEIAASGIRYSNEETINLGKILGMVTSIIGIVAIAFMVVYVIIMIVTFATFAATVADF